MKTPSPLVPQGALPIQGRSHVPIIVSTILALHFVLLGALLIAGCKPTATSTAYAEPTNNAYDALPAWVEPTNPNPFEATGSVPPPASRAEFAVPPIPPPAMDEPVVRRPSPPPAPLPGAVIPGGVVVPSRAPAAPAENVHVVVSGDSFYSLAKRYGVSRQAIAAANPRVQPSRLQIGARLTIPRPEPPGPEATVAAVPSNARVHVVSSGDTLSRIARTHKTTVAKLRAVNNLRTDRIKVGQKLTLPAQ